MKNMYKAILVVIFLNIIIFPTKLVSQDYWVLDSVQAKEIDNTLVKTYSLNNKKLKRELKTQKLKTIFLPNEYDDLELFILEEIFLMSPELSIRHPSIKTYKGYSEKRPNASLRVTLSPKGISGWINIPGKENVFIQPNMNLKGKHYVYKRSERYKKEWECKTISEFDKNSDDKINNTSFNRLVNNDKRLRTFKLAVAATGEYTNFWDDNNDENGTGQEDALLAIVSTMNRVNSVYETDLSITMQLVSGVEIIYTDPELDPYSNDLNGEVQQDLTANIGESNYDIGHLFTYDANDGNAGCIGCVCLNGSKGRGYTSYGFSSPNFLTDHFDIDYVAHEIGHQFGATHTFAFNTEGTGTNVEPGSGSTIMGYAGITGSDDIQQHSDPYFNYKSFEDIINYIETQSCYSSTDLSNNPPVADAGINYTIPIGTAYELKASASDLDNDQLTYCWEQIDSGSMTQSEFGPENYSGSTARSLSPSLSSKRSIPNLTSVLNGNLTQTNPSLNSAWETVPNVPRELNWGLTVRDRSPTSTGQGGQSSRDSVTIKTTGKAGPFAISSQSDEDNIWGTGDRVPIRWDVSNTNLEPINTSEVSILLSLDEGQNFSNIIIDSTPNDGEYVYVVPSGLSSENARIKIIPKNSIYYAVNKKKIKIQQRSFAILFDKISYDFCNPLIESIFFDVGIYDSLSDPISLNILNPNNGLNFLFNQNSYSSNTTDSELTLTGLSNLTIGKNTIEVIASSGNVSTVFPIEINNYEEFLFSPELLSPIQGDEEVIDFKFEWNVNPNASKYLFEISSSLDFSTTKYQINTANSFLNIAELDSGVRYYWRVSSINECGSSPWSDSFSFISARITNNNFVADNLPIELIDAITDQNSGYTSSIIFISDVNTISSIEVLVNITHTYVSDLSLFLVSPDGTVFSLAENVGEGSQQESGDNFTNTLFSEDSNISINNGSPPFTGSFRPNQPLDELIGKSAFGYWTLSIEDDYPNDTGELLNFQLNITLEGEILKNSDFDSFADSIDNCPKITNQNQSDEDLDGEGDICDFDAQNNFEILKFDESCITRNNGLLSISAFADFDYNYSLLGPNGYNEQGGFKNSSTKTINNLQSGDYLLCIYSNNDQQIERCFTAVINEPEPLSVNTIVNYVDQELNLNLKGGSNYFVELNGRSFNYEKLANITLPLKKGINQFKVSTDLGCQGTYERTINISERAYVSPNPVSSVAEIFIGNQGNNLDVEFFSIEGEHIKSSKIVLYDGKNSFEWSMSKYPPGVYIMNIKTKEGSQSVKIIKK